MSPKILKGMMQARKTILVVDDDPQMRVLLRRVIEASGLDAQVLEAADGLEALNKLCQNRVDLLVTDLMMPGVDGASLVQSLKNLKEGLRPKSVVVVSAKISTPSTAKIGPGLMATFMAKPFDHVAFKEYLLAAFKKPA